MNKFSTETENHSTMSNFIEKSSFCIIGSFLNIGKKLILNILVPT